MDRETATHYWLTVYAQDHGLVPLHSHIEVYIEVKDTNDHIPMTLNPVYYGSVPEGNSLSGQYVTQVQAFDLDKSPAQTLTYSISRFDPKKYFTIETDTGWFYNFVLSVPSLGMSSCVYVNSIPQFAVLPISIGLLFFMLYQKIPSFNPFPKGKF